MNRAAFLGAATLALLPACGGGGAGTAGAGGASSSVGVTTTAGVGGAGGAVAHSTYPDIATLHDLGVSRTCSLNGGVCHSQKNAPDLTRPEDLLATVGMPCQLAAQDPSMVVDECEVPGDVLILGGAKAE